MLMFAVYILYTGVISFLYIRVSVYADGSICLDILQNRWSPTYDVSAILTSIQVRVIVNIHIRLFVIQ